MGLYLPLPLELVVNVIHCAVPSSPGVLLKSSHPTTKLLLAFTRVCQETRRVANRYINQHCIVLTNGQSLQKRLVAMDNRPDLCSIKSLFLDPFFDDTIDDMPTCRRVRDFFLATCHTLTKLVIDMPLRTCYPEDDRARVRPVLRRGFESLVNLVELVSVQDETYLDIDWREHFVLWKRLPRLRRLALYNVDADEDFWKAVAFHSSLQTLILTNADGLREGDPETSFHRYATKPVTAVFCTPESRFCPWYKFEPTSGRPAQRTNCTLSLYVYELPQFAEDDNSRPLQLAIKDAALTGELWEWRGLEVRRADNWETIND